MSSLSTALLGDLRMNLVGDLVELPAHRVGDHRHALGQADVTDAAVLDLLRELLGVEARANLLLERQAPRARVLDAIDADAVDALADAGQRDRQRIHREARD